MPIPSISALRDACVSQVIKTPHQGGQGINNTVEHTGYHEAAAYRRLHASGLSGKGYIPGFYGALEDIRPQLWRPNLDMFLTDNLPPSAIFLKYIPEMEPLGLVNYTRERMSGFESIMKEIHAASVLYDHTSPGNMMIVSGAPREIFGWISTELGFTTNSI